jgi:hypothetical protein
MAAQGSREGHLFSTCFPPMAKYFPVLKREDTDMAPHTSTTPANCTPRKLYLTTRGNEDANWTHTSGPKTVLTRNELSLRLNLNAAHERLRELTTPETPKEELSDCSVWTHFKSNATVRQPARTTFAMLSLSLSEAQIAEAKLFPPGRQVRPNPGQFTARERC